MTRGLLKSGLAAILIVLMAAFGTSMYAQGGGSSTLSGIVSDASGGIMPGVDVVAKHNGTAATFPTVTDSVGRFTIPALPPGTYTVTVALSGFKTVVLPDVTLVTGTPAAVKVTLEVGGLQETVVVTGAAEVVQTQSAEVQTTVAIKQISSLPVVSRTALDYVVSLPGVETPGSVTRSSTINGLPTSSMNITLDGVNVQDKRGSEGFFMYIRPLMDSVEEITVSTSNPGAESSGSGASQIRMTTRAGTNKFSGSVVQHLAQPGGHERRRRADAEEEPELAVGAEHALLVQQARPCRRRPPATTSSTTCASRRPASAWAGRS